MVIKKTKRNNDFKVISTLSDMQVSNDLDIITKTIYINKLLDRIISEGLTMNKYYVQYLACIQ